MDLVEPKDGTDVDRSLRRSWEGLQLRRSGAGRHSCYAQRVRAYSIDLGYDLTGVDSVFQPTFASFSNIFGRKPMILTTISLFLAGTVIAGLSNGFTQMLIGRSIQGVGGGGIIALTEIIVTDLVPLRLRGNYFGILSSMWSVGSVCGPILGGGFSQNVSWVCLSLLVPKVTANKFLRRDGSSTSTTPLSASVSSSSSSFSN